MVALRREEDRTAGDSLLVHPRTGRTVDWEREAVARFAERMFDVDRPFPCIFGVDALRKATLRFAFVPAPPDDVPHLAAALREFVSVAPQLGSRTSLVTFFEPADGLDGIDDYRDHFWHLLGELRRVDSEPWPAGVSPDPEDPHWEFSFAGMPMFVVANTPVHKQRASRQFDLLAITFQPRFVFDDLAESSPQGQRARRVIRGRLSRYDSLPPTPLLGSFGTPGNREWLQYFLEDDNSPVPDGARCPLHATAGGGSMGPAFTERAVPPLDARLTALLPHQGSFELQNDQPGKVHNWHRHSVDEELFVVSGDLLLFWDSADGYRERYCPAGTWIQLPAGATHGSLAGDGGAVYVIRPEGGVTARTEFLAEAQFPHPTPDRVAETA